MLRNKNARETDAGLALPDISPVTFVRGLVLKIGGPVGAHLLPMRAAPSAFARAFSLRSA